LFEPARGFEASIGGSGGAGEAFSFPVVGAAAAGFSTAGCFSGEEPAATEFLVASAAPAVVLIAASPLLVFGPVEAFALSPEADFVPASAGKAVPSPGFSVAVTAVVAGCDSSLLSPVLPWG